MSMRPRSLDLLVGGQHVGDLPRVEVGDLAAGRSGRRRVGRRGDVRDLGPLDLRRQVTQQRGVGALVEAAHRLGHEPELGLGDLGELAAVDVRPEEACLPQRGGVERAGLDAAGTEVAQPDAHLVGGLGGERDRQDLGGLVDTRRDAVGHAVGDGTGLARARAGDDADGAAQRQSDLALLRIEPGQQVVRVRHAVSSGGWNGRAGGMGRTRDVLR
jgi:hypothetical protein